MLTKIILATPMTLHRGAAALEAILTEGLSARWTRVMALEPRNRALFTESMVHMAVQTYHLRPNSRIILTDETLVTDC